MHCLLSSFCFYCKKNPIKYILKQCYVNNSSSFPYEIHINRDDFFSDINGYLFTSDCLQKIGVIDLLDLWDCEFIDMGIYYSIRNLVGNFGWMMNCNKEDYILNITNGQNYELTKIISQTSFKMIDCLRSVDDVNLTALLKGSKDPGSVVLNAHSHLLFGNSIRVDDSIISVIRAWIVFVIWIDFRYKNKNGPIKISAIDEVDWKLFFRDFNISNLN